MLGFRTCTSQGGLKVLSSRKSSRKIRAVGCPFGGVKTRNYCAEMGEPRQEMTKWPFELINGTFYLLGSTLPDLRGGRGSIFCAFNMHGVLVFLPVDWP